MFKNVTPLSFVGELKADAALCPFVPCTPAQELGHGFINDHTWRVERRTVPASAIKKHVADQCAAYERETGRKAPKALRADFKAFALTELLPRAFSKTRDVAFHFDRDRSLLLIGSTTTADTDLLTAALVEAHNVSLAYVQTKFSPGSQMARWLMNGEAPGALLLGRSCVLTGEHDTVRYDGFHLDCSNVREHLLNGKLVNELALVLDDKAAFTLTADFRLKGVALEGETGEDDDAERLIATETVGQIIDALVEVLQ